MTILHVLHNLQMELVKVALSINKKINLKIDNI